MKKKFKNNGSQVQAKSIWKIKIKKKKTQINYSKHVKSTTQFILKND